MAVEFTSSLGSRVKRCRLNANMSVKALAEKVGVSTSYIYQLEQGKVSASYSTIKSIARALYTSVSALTDDDPPQEWFLVRTADRKRLVVDDEGVSVNIIPFTGERSRRMQPLELVIEPGKEFTDFPYSHDREELLCLVSGELQVVMNSRHFDLKEGDSIYFMFHKPTSIRNTGDRPARALWVISPAGD